jgi:succinate dehydrogenase / fumarate reductase membrane anchor subunit
MSNNYGTKRIVTGASYGLRDWMAQRVTAVLMALFAIFSQQWMKFLTFVVILSILYHAWVGVRDIFMDYIKPVGIRLSLHVFAIVWLLGCAGWAIQVLWRL